MTLHLNSLTKARGGESRYLTSGARKIVMLRIPTEMKDRLETLSALQGMSINEWMIRFLEKHLDGKG